MKDLCHLLEVLDVDFGLNQLIFSHFQRGFPTHLPIFKRELLHDTVLYWVYRAQVLGNYAGLSDV